MATTKPKITRSEIWAKAAAAIDKAKPAQIKVDDGWAFGEVPPFQIFNWFKNIYSQMFVHIQEYGIPTWSSDIEYQKGALTMHLDEVWRSSTINTNKVPGTATDWTKPFDIKLPIGSVVAFRGLIADIPTGWSLITDLNDKFLMGTSVVGSVGQVGGFANSSLPSHTHSATMTTVGAHSHTANHNHTAASNTTGVHTHDYQPTTAVVGSGLQTGSGWKVIGGGTLYPTTNAGSHYHTITVNTKTMNTSNAGNHVHAITVKSTGTGATGTNLPPYKKIMYIERIS